MKSLRQIAQKSADEFLLELPVPADLRAQQIIAGASAKQRAASRFNTIELPDLEREIDPKKVMRKIRWERSDFYCFAPIDEGCQMSRLLRVLRKGTALLPTKDRRGAAFAVRGYVRYPFAIDFREMYDASDEIVLKECWHVTHLPTGGRAPGFEHSHLHQAKKNVEALNDISPAAWLLGSFGDPDGTVQRIAIDLSAQIIELRDSLQAVGTPSRKRSSNQHSGPARSVVARDFEKIKIESEQQRDKDGSS